MVGAAGFGALTARVAAPMVSALLPLAAAAFGLVLVLEFLQTGPVFSTQALRFDFNRLNPGQGLKRLFSWRLLIEAFKGSLKLGLYAAAAIMVIAGVLSDAAAITDVHKLTAALGDNLLKLIAWSLGIAVVIAAIDQIVVRRDFLKKMRMSRRDVKREHRDREGDSRMKHKRKELHGQFATTSQSLRGVRGADVIVVNPVHFAVALRYQPGVTDAPVVVSRGSHELALRLRRLAFAYGVPVIVDPPLARRLFRGSVLRQPIPADLFRPVADLYLTLRRKHQPQDTTSHA
ncbi:MAG TPA: EscU/YscU/HrcU family type III secretion system export apparatus switch protein [Brevundimonas sp.]|nr:EscU/YscU/HrcU family type III secretion system export apparatus switch protein [Brevundimonas sp.]